MVIFIEGTESFLAHRLIRQLKEKYLAKNPDGTELIDVDVSAKPINWADLQAAPLFAQSRLILIRQVASLPVAEQESLASYLEVLPSSSVVAVWDGKPLKKGKLLDTLKSASKKLSAAPLVGSALVRHIDTRAKDYAIELEASQRSQLISEFGDNLWALETELAAMSLGLQNNLGKDRASEPFAFYRAVQQGDWGRAKQLALQDYRAGVPIELMIGSMASVLRKNHRAANRPAIVETLVDIDIGLKTGLLDEAAAVGLLRADLPKPRQNRVVWEEVWEEQNGG